MHVRKAIVYIAGMRQNGLELDSAQFVVALNSEIEKRKYLHGHENGIDFYAASVFRGGEIGWGLIKKHMASERIIKGDNAVEVVSKIGRLFESYNEILIEAIGGRTQMQLLIPLKREFGKRMHLVASIYYFRNGSLLKYPTALFLIPCFLKYVDMVIFGCPYAARIFPLSSLLFNRSKACVMPLLGASQEIHNGRAYNSEKLEDVLNDRTLFKCVYFAEFRKLKNHLWLTKAILPLVKDNSNLRIIYCGSNDNAVGKKVLKLIKSAGVEEQFYITGRVARELVPSILNRCDCSIIASQTETYGFTYVEPMLNGLPVLGTRIGVGEYAIQDYCNGFAFNFDSYDGIRGRLRYLIEHRDVAKDMGKAGKRIALEMFSMSAVAKMRVNLYASLFSQK